MNRGEHIQHKGHSQLVLPNAQAQDESAWYPCGFLEVRSVLAITQQDQ